MKDKANRQIAAWLYCGAFCLFLQILLGGITRLTGSGLSITEWQPLLGALPPLTSAEWEHSFSQYKEIAQFKKLNSHFSLVDYQLIFFWEWLHRNWARLIGLIFIIPFIVFLLKKKISPSMFLRLMLLLLLGALQAVIGWIMVKSGLNDTAVAVNELKLAIHFMMALLLLSYTLWMAFKLSISPLSIHYTKRLKNIAGFTLLLLLVQLFYGALMAGSKAALAAPTWPDMNGFVIPPELYTIALRSAGTHLLTVQFIHRMLAYSIGIMVLVLYKNSSSLKAHRATALLRHAVLALVFIQIFLGVVTLLNSITPSFRIYAILHQCTGILLSMGVLLMFYLSHKKGITERSA
ncbi:COX15/CtaA family protein [Pedobacter hartonius]|uniref:Cytochrome c oxidase assembly protein subunit 15 n=1 Tax=Pedobacter hartonius TaxID=425514 RepID=A0A1H4EY80_9SPHI|nr:COX15/CtaA family protein [Pedobacter hartonius]SEA89931.1 cytochrome c oxidase assembly protein subunit 15 [Pedobacter hartonius]